MTYHTWLLSLILLNVCFVFHLLRFSGRPVVCFFKEGIYILYEKLVLKFIFKVEPAGMVFFVQLKHLNVEVLLVSFVFNAVAVAL